jgi:aromatic-L-amino-acid decarboxylase
MTDDGSGATAQLGLAGQEAVALDRLTRELAGAWRGFRRARPGQPALDDALRSLVARPLPEHGVQLAAALDDAIQVLDRSIAQARPRFFGFVGGSGLETAVLAEALAASFDINLASWSAAASELERQAIRWLGDFIGFPASDGHFTSGGTVSTLTALAAARERALPGSRRAGLAGARVAVYASAEAHGSVVRATELLGAGADALRLLPQRPDRGVDPGAVADAIAADRAAGVVPLAVVATAGTTLTGAIDPLDRLADLAAEHGIWLHVDGAYGAPAASTAAAGPLFAGLERADSVSVDAHKWLFVPKACGALLVRDAGALPSCFAHAKPYMAEADDEPHAVDRTLEYSRPFRALKLWMAFRVHGAAAFRAAIERNLAQARLLYRLVSAEPDLRPVAGPPKLSVMPFQHLPAGGGDVDAHNAALVRRLQEEGHVWVTSAVIDGAVAIRPCFVNYRTTDDDVRALVDTTRGAAVAVGA